MKSIVDRYKAAETEQEPVAQKEMTHPRNPKQSHMKQETKQQAQVCSTGHKILSSALLMASLLVAIETVEIKCNTAFGF